MGKKEFSEKLTDLFEKAEDSPGMNEETLRIKFAQSDILNELGYTDENIYWEEGLENQKRTDITCKDDIGDFNVVFEFKKPSEDNLASHKTQLKNRYVVPYKAKYGVLYNGFKLIFYERQGNELNEIFRASANELEGNYLDGMFRRIKKPDRATTNLDEVVEYMEEYQNPEERLSLDNQIAREYFYENFQLEEDSVFGNLVINTIKLFKDRQGDSKFLRSAYQFWKRSYAKELNKSQIPDEWKPLFEKADLSTGNKEDRFIFSFCLETAYATFTRLILTKSAEDYGFPGAGFSTILRRQLEESAWDGGVPQPGYADMSLEIIREMQGKLISSVFEEDIFYWWTEPYDDVERYTDYFKGEVDVSEEMSQFGKSLAEILLTVYKYEFSEVGEEDILGVLYQKYFDRETRKALGEFYTPKEVVNYILDSVGYNGEEVLNKRILDPACGSGTFLVEALDRYLEQAEKSGKAEEVGWRSVLQDLCNEYHVIGFDVHPFATIMAQIQFTLKLLPYYRKAIDEEDSYFVLQRLPIFRTDSLYKEKDIGNLTLEESTRGEVISMPIELPVQGQGDDDFFEKDFKIPLYDTVSENTSINNTQEYFGALQALFDAVKDEAKELDAEENPEMSEETLSTILQRADYVRGKNWDSLASYLKPDADLLLERIQELKHEFDDGRLVKSIEDVMLAAILKNEMKYEFVVGNPPYVPIQSIPDKHKERYEDAYRYTEGNYDLYVPFMERGVDWLKPNGKVSYIVSNRFLLTQYAETMREKLPQEITIDKMVDMRDSRVFEDALNYPAVFVFSNRDHPQDHFPSVRIFKDPEEPKEALQDMEKQIENIEDTNDYSKGEYSDAFNVKYNDLEAEGWHLMPQKERKIMDKLDDGGEKLHKYTKTGSGAFQGVSTSKDDVYVLRIIGEEGQNYRVVPKGGGESFSIEKEIVRPFLFGKDIDRWNIKWNNWAVIFPYDDYDGSKKLIPAREYSDDFDYGKQYMEERYPKAWDYLKDNEDVLRSRDRGQFEKNGTKEHKWYGLAYPRSKNCYDYPKLLVQVSSDEADIAYDSEGEYVFTGGGTSGAYGILPENISSRKLAGLINSKPLDFYLKHISTVYSGKSYSYGDQFLKKLPITDMESETAKFAEELRNREDLKTRIDNFPLPHFNEIKQDGEIREWDEVKHTTVRGYYPLNIRRQKDLEGNSKIKLGKDDWMSSHKIDSEAKQDYVIKAINGKRFSKEEQIVIPLPRTDEAAEKALEMLEEDKKELENGKTKEELEEELNNSVYSVYNIEDQEKEVVDDFLDRF